MVGTGPDVSPCFLMNVLFEQLGWEGDAYMQAADACRREVPLGVLHRAQVIDQDGALILGQVLVPNIAVNLVPPPLRGSSSPRMCTPGTTPWRRRAIPGT